jgi:sulfite oxidase
MEDRQRRVRTTRPYNAEPPLDRLRASLITPRQNFYVRSHGDIAALDGATHQIHVRGQVRTPLDLTVKELRARFQERSILAVLQCAGNRRGDMQRVRPTLGDPWAPGAIGNAEWTGVSLRDVLQAAGAAENPNLRVAFSACDTVEMPKVGRFTYGVSIPIQKALSPEVLLAYAMNGEPLAPEHGCPLRVVVPGFAGVRSPKWLGSVTVQDMPADNPIQQHDYKLWPSDVTEATVDRQTGVTIYEMPLNSAICEPSPDAELRPGPTALHGYAIATAREIVRVDVSGDGGRTWTQARLTRRPDAPWSWTLWSTTLDLPEGQHELAVRAWDCAGQTQPAHAEDVWNFKGYLNTAWHRVPVLVR